MRGIPLGEGKYRQIVEAGSDVGVRGAQGLFPERQGRLRHGERRGILAFPIQSVALSMQPPGFLYPGGFAPGRREPFLAVSDTRETQPSPKPQEQEYQPEPSSTATHIYSSLCPSRNLDAVHRFDLCCIPPHSGPASAHACDRPSVGGSTPLSPVVAAHG